jgi:hypothetical protein
MLFASRTILTVTDVLVKWVTILALVLLWILVGSQLTVSKESFMSAKCRSGKILLGWHPIGESSGGSLGYSGNL